MEIQYFDTVRELEKFMRQPIHFTVLALLKTEDGRYRAPFRAEWTEDNGLGYMNRIAFENDAKKYKG